mgnify:CR=1 FL=1
MAVVSQVDVKIQEMQSRLSEISQDPEKVD